MELANFRKIMMVTLGVYGLGFSVLVKSNRCLRTARRQTNNILQTVTTVLDWGFALRLC